MSWNAKELRGRHPSAVVWVLSGKTAFSSSEEGKGDAWHCIFFVIAEATPSSAEAESGVWALA